MKTLVIHPEDKTTNFLKPIYSGITDATVLTGGLSKDEIRELIKEHDRIIMLGHGSPGGLFGVGKFGGWSYIIDETMVKALSNKPNNIYVWCNADKFLEQHPTLQGFYSGMFISEVGEARMYDIDASQDVVNESNNLFADIVGKNIMMESRNICGMAQFYYYIEGNKVSAFNNQRLYYR